VVGKEGGQYADDVSRLTRPGIISLFGARHQGLEFNEKVGQYENRVSAPPPSFPTPNVDDTVSTQKTDLVPLDHTIDQSGG